MFLTVYNKYIRRSETTKPNDDKNTMGVKAKLFITALYFWGFVIYRISLIFNGVLRMILTHFPDFLIINPCNYIPTLESYTPDNTEQLSERVVKPKILEARVLDMVFTDKPFTNKLKAIIDIMWDDEIGEASLGSDKLTGGLRTKDIAKIYPAVSKMYLVAKYVFEKNADKIPDDELSAHVKFIFVDFAKNLIYRNDENPMTNNKSEKMTFGEVVF